MKYRIIHKTYYVYVEPAPVCHNLVHLAPRTTVRQTPTEYRLAIDPAPAFIAARDDYFGNRTEYFSIEGAHRQLQIVAASTVEVRPLELGDDADTSSGWEQCIMNCGATRGEAIIEPKSVHLSFPSPHIPLSPTLRSYAEPDFSRGRPVLSALRSLTSRIHLDFQFDQRATTVDTPLAEVLRLRRGVCQDFAHLFTGAARSMGLAARYVSGYLRTVPPPGRQRLVGADASHAWSSVWCGPLGWIDFDPTNNCLVSDDHITVAWGRDYGDVCPIQGVFIGGGEQRMGVSVDVEPIG